MKEGKVGSDIVLKAGVMMGEWADKQGTLSVALQQSAAKQEQFNNKLKEMSLLILKSGLDQALAAMFSALVPIVEVVGTGLAFIFKVINKVLNGFKALYNYTQEHPIASSVIATTSALVLLLPILKAVSGVFLAWAVRGLFALNALNAGLLVTRARALLVKGAFGALFYLFTELDGFFKGEENNFLMTWYYTVQLIISELDVLFAKMKYNIFMFKQNPLGYFKETFAPEQQEPMSFKKAMTMGGVDWAKYLYNYIGDGIQNGFHNRIDAAQAVQQNTPTPVNQNITVNIDASKTSPQLQSSIVNGNMDLFSKMVGTEVNNQMRLSPHR